MLLTKPIIHRFESYISYHQSWPISSVVERVNSKSRDLSNIFGAIAQLVEQRTENPRVPSSTLGGTAKWSHNSAGSECYSYKVDVVGSNPTGTTN